MIPYPEIDPVAVAIGPLKVRWYGLMYLIGFAIAWFLARSRARKPEFGWKVEWVDDLIFYAALGLILGARIGYMVFYGFDTWSQNPLAILKIWEGGMSFHGGLLGLILCVWLYGRYGRYRIPPAAEDKAKTSGSKGQRPGVETRRVDKRFFEVTDFVAPLAPLGLLCGRLGNFINGELWGKPTDVPWAFVVDGVARHASQLYEGLLEGVVLFAILWFYSGTRPPRMAVSGAFLLFYGIFRFAVEFVRIPDAHIGYLAFGWLTMGQVLTMPMILLGLTLLALAYRTRPTASAH
jgi:phosphatidylglycerol:prolipoprotein diacylglycerol transferase